MRDGQSVGSPAQSISLRTALIARRRVLHAIMNLLDAFSQLQGHREARIGLKLKTLAART